MKKVYRYWLWTAVFFLLFLMLTAAVCAIDVRPIGPMGSKVGLATVNGYVQQMVGAHGFWYGLSEVMGIAALLTACGFGIAGLYQCLKRGRIRLVDKQLVLLGMFYVLMCALYLVFEWLEIAFRPVLVDGALEASYPSSHTLLVLCVMLSAAEMAKLYRCRRRVLLRAVQLLAYGISALTVTGRLLSGVHWFTDVLGGVILSAALLMLLRSVAEYLCPAGKGLDREE